MAVALIPLLLAGACVLVRALVTREVFDTVFGWAGLLCALAVVFAFYWAVLVIELAIFRCLRRRDHHPVA